MGKVISMAESAEKLAREKPDLALKYAQSTATMVAKAQKDRQRRFLKLVLTAVGLVILALVLLGCDDPAFVKRYSNGLTYFKDSRTGLCFAGRALFSNNAVMTYVPCTPEVEKLLVSLDGGAP